MILSQKKVKDYSNDLKLKKDKIEEQDIIIKKLQERLQSKIDELTHEQKKGKLARDELERSKKGTDSSEHEIKLLEKECEQEI